MMRIASNVALGAAAVCVLLAIWTPGDTSTVRWLLTALVAVFLGAVFGVQADRQDGQNP